MLGAIIALQAFSVLSHTLATLGFDRPMSTRNRRGNQLATVMDFASYACVLVLMLRAEAGSWVIVPAIGAAAHVLYLILQRADSFWRTSCDDYTSPTILHGPIQRIKITAAAIDTVLHSIGFFYLTSLMPWSTAILGGLLGGFVCCAMWKPFKRRPSHELTSQ
jgi:hypothetical protein